MALTTCSTLQATIVDDLSYDCETGVFAWRKDGRGKSRRIGQIAGCQMPNGYVKIKVAGRQWLAHRLAWVYAYGTEPPRIIDHINRNKSDNAISNLRDGSGGINEINSKPPKDSPFGISGVRAACKPGHYQAYTAQKGAFKSFYHGPDFFEACCARKSWEAKFWEEAR